MTAILVSTHSGLRWVALILVLITTIIALTKWLGNKEWTEGNRKLSLFALITVHVQLLIGLLLYFFFSGRFTFSATSMEHVASRYFMVEHAVFMILGIASITIGYSVSKRKVYSRAKAKWITISFLFGLMVFLAGIPWPFLGLNTRWF